MSNKTNFISVIVPCYRQEKTIVSNLIKIEKTLQVLSVPFEIIAVVDGKVDKTYENARKVANKIIKVVGYANNYGKGYALRYGMARSRGNIIAFIDAGEDLNPEGLQMLYSHFQWYDADIIVGSKWHPVSKVVYPWWRTVLSRGYGMLVKILFGLRVRDTQLGMKIFKREVLEKVLPRLIVRKYAFDIEILAVADRLGYSRIYEAPVELNWSSIESTVSKRIVPTIWDMLLDTLGVFYRLRIEKYYDSTTKHKRKYDPDLDFRINVS